MSRKLGATPVAMAVMGALLALGLVRCSSFGANVDDGAGDAAPDAPYARTGVSCGTRENHCAVGAKCCGDGTNPVRCAANCVDVGASFNVFECGQTSDCKEGQECCGGQNGSGRCDGRLVGSTCVPAGNCHTCGEAEGGMARLCDPRTNAECPGKKCVLGFDNSVYTACSL